MNFQNSFGHKTQRYGPHPGLESIVIQYWFKTLLQQGISELVFYGDVIYKFKRIVGKPNFSDQFKKDNQTI